VEGGYCERVDNAVFEELEELGAHGARVASKDEE